MPLTSEELAGIDKVLGRIEKKARPWRTCRWFLVPLGLFTTGLGFYALMSAQRCWEALTFTEAGHNVTHAELLERIMVLGFFCKLYVAGTIVGLTGIAALAIALENWNKARRDGLLVKLARSFVEEQRHSDEGPA